MATLYALTPELRVKLKQPLGTLIRGSFDGTMKQLNEILEKEMPLRIISVGDTVTRNLTKNHVAVQLAIVDNRCMRRRVEPVEFKAERTMQVRNPAAAISEEASKAIQDALIDGRSCKILVEGEEDLLTLVAIRYAPDNSLVVYGQPYEGIVVVRVTSAKKAEVERILAAMQLSSKD